MGSTTDAGYRRFREALPGTLKAGMIVPQNELCDLLGLSLSPLRETLVLREEFGLVEIKPRRLLAASSGPGAALDAIERRRA